MTRADMEMGDCDIQQCWIGCINSFSGTRIEFDEEDAIFGLGAVERYIGLCYLLWWVVIPILWDLTLDVIMNSS